MVIIHFIAQPLSALRIVMLYQIGAADISVSEMLVGILPEKLPEGMVIPMLMLLALLAQCGQRDRGRIRPGRAAPYTAVAPLDKVALPASIRRVDRVLLRDRRKRIARIKLIRIHQVLQTRQLILRRDLRPIRIKAYDILDHRLFIGLIMQIIVKMCLRVPHLGIDIFCDLLRQRFITLRIRVAQNPTNRSESLGVQIMVYTSVHTL